MKRFIILFYSSFISSGLFAQTPENLALAKTWKKMYASASVMAKAYNSFYSYEKTEHGPEVYLKEEVAYLSLSSGKAHIDRLFYDENSTITSYKVKGENGGRVKFDKFCGHLETKEVFYSDAEICAYQYLLPKQGLVTNAKWAKAFHDAKYLTKVFFHKGVPVKSRKVSFFVPYWAEVELKEVNFDGFDIKKTITKDKKGTYHNFIMEGLPAPEQHQYSRSRLHTYPHILVLTKQYRLNNTPQRVLTSTDDLYAWYARLVGQVNNDPTPLEPIVSSLVNGATTNEEKIKKIYYWVQDNIKYIAFEEGLAGFRPENAQTVLANRYGDCKGMANLLKVMLKIADLDARLTWIGTNAIPYSYDIPSLAVDNHMICTVMDGNKKYMLDPTEKFSAFGHYADRIQGKEVLIEAGENYLKDTVPMGYKKQNLINREELMAISGEVLSGNGTLHFNGEQKKQLHYITQNIKGSEIPKLWKRMVVTDFTNNDRVSIAKTPNFDRDQPLALEYQYSLANRVSKFGDELYVGLDFNKDYQRLEMNENWLNDYDFGEKVWRKCSKRIKIPDGYQVQHLPASFTKEHPDFSVSISYKQIEGHIHYEKELAVEQGVVKRKDFATWNTFINALDESYRDQIILKKTK